MGFPLFIVPGPREPDDLGGANASGAAVRSSRGDAIHDLSEQPAAPFVYYLLSVSQFVVGFFFNRITRAMDSRGVYSRTLHTARKERERTRHRFSKHTRIQVYAVYK